MARGVSAKAIKARQTKAKEIRMRYIIEPSYEKDDLFRFYCYWSRSENLLDYKQYRSLVTRAQQINQIVI